MVEDQSVNGGLDGVGTRASAAREYFDNVRSAQRAIDRRLAILDAMRSREDVRAQRYDRIGSATHDNHDAMTATDARMDAEAAARDEVAELSAIVEDGRAVCRGIRAANPTNRLWGDALDARYCSDMPWRPVASMLGVSERLAQDAAAQALEWVDSVGIAAAHDGMGQATLF